MVKVEELDAKALGNTVADKLSKIKDETLANTLGHVDSRELSDTIAHTLAEVHVKKRSGTLCDVKPLSPVEVLAYMLAWKKEETNATTPREMWRLTHWSRRWTKRLAVVKAKTVSDILGNVDAHSHVMKLAITIEKMEAKTIGCRLRDVEGEALLDRTG